MNKRARFVAWGCLLVVIGGVAAAGTTFLAVHASPPRAIVPNPVVRVDCGKVPRPVVATYEILNRGGQPLVLGEPQASCGCTAASVARINIPPGERTVLTAEGRPAGAGERRVRVTVPTNSPTEPEITLSLVMVSEMAVPYVDSSSGPIRLGFVDGSLTNARDIIVNTREKEGTADWLACVEVTLPGFEAAGGLSQTHNYTPGYSAKSYNYRISSKGLDGQGPSEDRSGQVLFEDRSGKVVFELPVLVFVHHPVYSVPRSLFASTGINGDLEPLSVMLMSDDKSLHLDADQVGNPVAPLVVKKTHGSGRLVEFRITLSQPLVTDLNTELTFKTNQSGTHIVTVPVHIRSRRNSLDGG